MSKNQTVGLVVTEQMAKDDAVIATGIIAGAKGKGLTVEQVEAERAARRVASTVRGAKVGSKVLVNVAVAEEKDPATALRRESGPAAKPTSPTATKTVDTDHLRREAA